MTPFEAFSLGIYVGAIPWVALIISNERHAIRAAIICGILWPLTLLFAVFVWPRLQRRYKEVRK